MSPCKLKWSQQNVNNAFDQSEIAPKICNTPQARKKTTHGEHRRISGYPACLRRRYFGGDIRKPEVRLRYGLWLGFLKIWLARVISSSTKFSWMEKSASYECLQVSTTRLVLISLAFPYRGIGADLGTICATFVPIIRSIRPTFIRKQVITLSPDKDIGWSLPSDLFPTSKLSEDLQNALQVFQRLRVMGHHWISSKVLNNSSNIWK